MSTYTKDENIYFLNDKNISQELSDTTVSKVNSIPSLNLVSAIYNDLSAEDKRLNDYANDIELSVDGVSVLVNDISTELSGTLSTYTNVRIDELCSTVDVCRIEDKAELSNALSTYTDVLIQKLSDDLSIQVDNEFVHKDGDVMSGKLDIDNMLSVSGQSNLDGKVVIKGNLTQGDGSTVPAVIRGVALGANSTVKHNDSFVWNGHADNEYESNEHGTFNINPENKSNGFYIADESLSDIIHNDVQLTANGILATINELSNKLSTDIDARRNDDKAELSNVLSTYSNTLSTELSNAINDRRSEDKTDLSNALSTYVNDLCASISSTIDNDKYSVASTINVKYVKENRNVIISIKDRFGEATETVLPIDEITGSGIVDRVEVLTPPTPGIEVPTVRIWWMPRPEHGEDQRSTDVPVSDLAQVYKDGTGIHITSGLSIEVTDYVAKAEVLDDTRATVNTLSTTTYNELTSTTDTVSAGLEVVKEYVNELSSKNGLIDQLSDANSFISGYINNTVETNIETNATNINTLSNGLSAVQDYAHTLSCKNGQIDQLSDDIKDIYKQINDDMAFVGHIEINFAAMKSGTPQSWISEFGNNLSGIFKFFNFAEFGYVGNGSAYDVTFTNIPDDAVVDDFANLEYITDDGFVLKHNDFIVVHNHTDVSKIPVEEIGPETVRTAANGLSADIYRLSATTRDNYVWLSGGNCISAEWVIGHSNHAIGGNNDFLGWNRFEQISVFHEDVETLSAYDAKVEILSANRVSVDNLSGYNVDIDDLSTYNAKIEILSASATSVDTLSAYDVEIDILSANRVSADNISAYNTMIDILSANRVSVDNLSGYNVDVDDLSACTANINDLCVGHDLSVENKLSVGVEVDLLSSNVTISNATVTSNFKTKINNTCEITGNLSVDNALTATTAQVEVKPDVKLDSKLSVENKTTLKSTLEVVDNATFDKNIEVKENATFRKNAIVDTRLSVSNNTFVATASDRLVKFANVEAESISCDWDKVVNPSNGFTLTDLSNAVSAKITIDDRINHELNGTSDLSIVKIAKDEYDSLVANNSPLSANVLYVVDSDYIDAYGQVIRNLTMTSDSVASEATNQHYVNNISSELSNTIEDVSANIENDISDLSTNLSNDIDYIVNGIYSALEDNLISDGNILKPEEIQVANVMSCLYNIMTFIKSIKK